MAQGRMFKVNWMIVRIKVAGKAGLLIDKEKIFAEFATFFGSTRRTAIEILNQIVLSGQAIIKGNEVWSKEAYEAEQILKCQTKTTSKEEKKNTDSAKS
jgi:hypothetical protein